MDFSLFENLPISSFSVASCGCCCYTFCFHISLVLLLVLSHLIFNHFVRLICFLWMWLLLSFLVAYPVCILLVAYLCLIVVVIVSLILPFYLFNFIQGDKICLPGWNANTTLSLFQLHGRNGKDYCPVKVFFLIHKAGEQGNKKARILVAIHVPLTLCLYGFSTIFLHHI